jgi:hypothetical protein
MMTDEPPSDERLAEIEAEHADPDHYEESTSCSALELIAEIRRLRGGLEKLKDRDDVGPWMCFVIDGVLEGRED